MLNLLQQAVISTLLDTDSAVYMSSTIESLPFKQRRKAIKWGLAAEFATRIVSIAFFYSILRENKILFILAGIKFTPDSISLFIAGVFLVCKSSWELYEFKLGHQQNQPTTPSLANFPRLMLEMTVINWILSVDTIIVLLSRSPSLSFMIVAFVFSALVRLFSLEKMAQLISQFPSLKIVLLVFLLLIGIELFMHGIWSQFPEEIFNTVMVFAIILAIIDRHRSRRG